MIEDTYKTEFLFNSRTATGLIAPAAYIATSEAEKKKICNGCGTAGWKGSIVPDTIWGLSITEACWIHDWMYYYGVTAADKFRADIIFLLNMLHLISKGSGFLKLPRRYRATTYYSAVVDLGESAFLSGKEGINAIRNS